MPSRSIKTLASLGVIAGLVGIFFWFQPASGTGAPPPAPPTPIKTITAVKKDVPVQIQALGTVVPFQTVSLKSRIDSQIIEVKFKDGDTVKKGDPLFILDSRALQAELDQAKADLAATQAQTNNLRKQYIRNQNLIKQQAISQELFESSKADLDAQDAATKAAAAELESIQVQIDYTTITAPIDGRAGTINVTAGNTVRANDTAPLVTINQIMPIQVQVSLPQDHFDELRSAMKTGTVSVTALRNTPDASPVSGTFSYIDNAIDQGTGTFIGRAVFANDDENLWPGMLVNLTMVVGRGTEAIVVPEVAIQNSPSGKFVFTIKDNQAKRSNVTVERIQDGLAVISTGLKGNEQVAIDGIMALKDGATVAVAKDTEKLPSP